MICSANQLTSFYMIWTLALSELTCFSLGVFIDFGFFIVNLMLFKYIIFSDILQTWYFLHRWLPELQEILSAITDRINNKQRQREIHSPTGIKWTKKLYYYYNSEVLCLPKKFEMKIFLYIGDLKISEITERKMTSVKRLLTIGCDSKWTIRKCHWLLINIIGIDVCSDFVFDKRYY